MDRSQLENLSPPDAAVALRSYARRFRELFSPAELRDGDVDLDAPGADGWSVIGALEAAEQHLAQLDAALASVADHDAPALPAGLFQRPGPTTGASAGPAGATAALDRLAATMATMADRVQRTPSKDWARRATVGSAGTDAHEVLREAVAYGRTALDLTGAALEAARRAAG